VPRGAELIILWCRDGLVFHFPEGISPERAYCVREQVQTVIVILRFARRSYGLMLKERFVKWFLCNTHTVCG
jgi:hypothetical protein